jgi:methyl-accepting chemotaxis protein
MGVINMDETLELFKKINNHLENHTKLLSNLVTKDDLEQVKQELRNELREGKKELKDDIEVIQDDVQIVKDSMTTLHDLCEEINKKVSEHDEIIIKRVK